MNIPNMSRRSDTVISLSTTGAHQQRRGAPGSAHRVHGNRAGNHTGGRHRRDRHHRPLTVRAGLARGVGQCDEVRIAVHSALGNGLNRLGGPPTAAAMQWVKAAAHTRSQADMRRAGAGILVARQYGGSDVDAVLCPAAARGAPSVQVAIALGGAPCAGGYFVRNHIPDGSPVEYALKPSIGGPHYDAWYPRYGLRAKPVPTGLWLHNLEHGAVVLLFKCSVSCPELVDQLRALYAALPPGRNAQSGGPRMLMSQYPDMDRPIAVVAWGYLLELDELETDAITRFYVDHVERGPECLNLACPA
jgi:hypothetical protein